MHLSNEPESHFANTGYVTSHDHHFLKDDEILKRNQGKALLVTLLAVVMTTVELLFGYLSSSMAILAEGWHMASHAGVLLITFLAYRLANSEKTNSAFSFGAG